jgi:carbon monoxide dehydrogenase subunit G
MKLEQSFEVAAPIERVWAALIDVEHVAPCLPGAAVTGRNEDGSFNGTFKVKIGPTSAAYSGKLTMDKVDEDARTATMNASGTDKRGQGGAKATIVSSVSEAGAGSTRVEVVTDYHITGRLARFGRGGMIEEISNKLLGQFAQSLQESLVAEPAPDSVAVDELGAGAARAGKAGEGEAAPAVAPEPAAARAAAAGEAGAEEAGAGGAGAGEAAPPLSSPPPSSPVPPQPPMGATVESEPVQGLSLVGSALWSRAKQNPAQLVALMLGFLLALRMLRRRS